jgi:hypothetical protein
VCRLFKTVADGGTWYKYTAVGRWAGASAGGSPNKPDKAQFNPQYYVALTRPGSVFISLQQDKPDRDGPDEIIGLKLLNKNGKRLRAVYTGEQLLTSGYCNTREVVAEGSLTPYPEPLTLFVSTFDAGKELSYLLTVYSDVPLDNAYTDGDSLRLIPASVEAK